jgi:uncharacterized protein (TIGR02246 family)
MRKILTWCALAVLALAVAPWLLAQKSAGTEKTVADLEHEWLKTQRTNDPAMLSSLLADGFVNTDIDGKVENKTESIAEAKTTKYSSDVDYLDLKVKVFGDTAIATGTFKGKVTRPDGMSEDQNERFTDTWVKMPSGKWQCVASHQSRIKM